MTPIVKVFMPPKEILLPAVESVLYSGMVGEGEHVYTFEDKFKSMFNIDNGFAVSSGTAALHMALILSGIQQGDEVVTTSMTAEPTNTSILQAGGVPVFADVDAKTGCLDIDSIVDMVTDRTKAILIVHYAGYVIDVQALQSKLETTFERHINIIEDCAHALGATIDGITVGTIGDFGIYSFQAIKHMTTLDGGFIVIKDHSLNKIAKKIRWFGMEKGVERTKLDLDILGYKYNMNNVTGIIGKIQLDYVEKNIKAHQFNAEYFNENLNNISGIEVVTLEKRLKPSYWLYTLLCDDSENVIKLLGGIEVMASKLHRPNHYHSLMTNFKRANMVNLDSFYKRLVHIPCGWWVEEEVRNLIVDTLKRG
ncbi:DegT/DnrJ/EryC1/StrS family aminotransferase [Lelliottia sp. V89_10]|uniref:DegT/DnrJ/EryC1/StrS family aminotransferase n=1 Tax=Lelliottia wanjuensis TaxID=3050585 RepID=UPI00249D8FCA|nr:MULTISPECIES: DegT/DnrJ/EryC1/StrS family aminotransferase [unclassified Lelliottia]MDI3361447.1 DegT/DnrJ/EryC1/StrS family aminotransferase [Lelliottia sp. V89_13]MDK9549352.1 DegT/DnrJ/EryC1/StrS family aminotransferase [Lelliottia sp. V89_5]MDK9596053.1 DegT/DnrJ/EryC1/StrS family aminotransferase [Lelliottia sp. V89_10]